MKQLREFNFHAPVRGALADRIRSWGGVDAYMYFDHYFMGHAPLNALGLREFFS